MVHCCRQGGSIVAGGSIVVGCGGVYFTTFFVINNKFHKDYLVPQMLLGSVFSKRGSAGRWVGFGTKDWCSEVGRGKDNG